jgi:hypothetical protein
MSWLYSRVLVEEYLGENSLDGEPSALSSGNPIPQAYCALDKMTVFSRLSRFGMTFKPLTEDRGEELLTLYLAGFPAKTSQPQEKVTDSTEPDRECGERWHAWLAKYDPVTSSWKTPQCSLLGEEQESLETLPRWGMTANGLLWEQPTLEPITRETASGLWLTPRATDVGKGEKQETFLKRMGDRTDRCAQSLAAQVNNPRTWPTPNARDWKDCPTQNLYRQIGQISTAVAVYRQIIWPTPRTAGMCGGTGSWELLNKNTTKEEARQMGAGNGGKLNPTWVEWLMGWPLGWTDLKPLEMDKSHCVPQKPGDC